MSLSFWHRSKKVGEQHGSYYVMVEYEDLLGSECRLLYSGVSSQGSGMMAHSCGDLRVLLVFRVLFVILLLYACVRVCLFGLRTLYYVVI